MKKGVECGLGEQRWLNRGEEEVNTEAQGTVGTNGQGQKRALTIQGSEKQNIPVTRQGKWGQILGDIAEHISESLLGLKGNGKPLKPFQEGTVIITLVVCFKVHIQEEIMVWKEKCFEK